MTAQDAPSLSKSWSVRSAHVPTYTGGKLTHCHTAGISFEDTSIPFLVLPVGGNVALVDSARGVRLATIRGDTVDEEEDEGIDREAITAYALAYDDQSIVTCSHNSMMRLYALKATSVSTIQVTLIKQWGKSGHTLPVTELEWHSSNIFCATGAIDGTVRIFDARGGFCSHVFRPLAGGEGGSGRLSVTAIQWMESLRELVLAIGRDDGSIAIHNLRQAEPVAILRDHMTAVTAMHWHENVFVTTGRDMVINLWGINANKERLPYTRVHTLPIYEQVEAMRVLPLTTTDSGLFMIATAGSKGRVRLWNVSDNRMTLRTEQPLDEVFGEARGGYLALQLTNQQQLIVADAEHNVAFLDVDQNLATIRTIVGHNDDILDLKAIPNADAIVVATNSAKVKLFDLNDFSCHVLDGHSATVLCVDVSPCGRFVASCGKDKEMRLWDCKNRRCVAIASGHTEAVGAAALSRRAGRYEVAGKAATNGGGAFAVTASMDRTLKRWNLPGVSVLIDLNQPVSLPASVSVRAHEKDVNVVTVSPNDALVATGSQDKSVRLWKAADLSLVATLKGHRRGVWDCQFSMVDRVVATASGDRSVKLWSLSDYTCVRTFQGHVASVLRVRFLSGGLQLVSSGADGLLKLWTIRTNECEATMDGHTDKVWALDLNSKGDALISGGGDSKLLVWEDTTKEVAAAKQAEEEEAILMDQKLANHLRHKEFTQALDIALKREKPQLTLKVLTAIIESAIEKGESSVKAVSREASSWSTDRLLQVLRYCREWNTRARNSQIAMTTVRAIVDSVSAHKLASIEGVPEILAFISPYAERHFDRLDRLYTDSYLLDFVLNAMGSLERNDVDEFSQWETQSRLVLPPKMLDGRVQTGGRTVTSSGTAVVASDESSAATVGDSDSDSD